MSQTRLIQIAVIVLILIITIVLYKLPISKEAETKSVPAMPASAFAFDGYLKGLKEQLDSAKVDEINKFETEANQNADSVSYEALGKIYDGLKQPAAAAYYFEKRAVITKTERGYLEAAYRYFDAFKAAGDTSMRTEMVNRAITNYKKVIEINPKNLDAKCDLGVLYTESGGNPMQGIMLLREVVKENPNHENAQLNLGMLSIKSGQYDKAIERFDNVMKANASRIDMYVYKAQAFAEMGDTLKSIENLKTFLSLSKDESMNEQVSAYLIELQKK